MRKLVSIVLLWVLVAGAWAEKAVERRGWGNTYVPKSVAPARHVYAVNLGGMKEEERVAITCLQGLLAREEPRIWLLRNETDRLWLDWHKSRGMIADYEIVSDWAPLFAWFGVKSAIIADAGFYRGDLLAANVAACEDSIVATPELAKRLGLKVKLDLRGRFTSYAEGLRWVWKTYQSKMNPQLCDFRQPELLRKGTFDYSYQWRAPMFWVAGKKDGELAGADAAAEKKVVGEILAAMKGNGVCVGFPEGGKDVGIGEVAGVELLSRHGFALICNNHLANASMLSGVRVEKFEQPKQPPPPPLQRDKVYIALALSDGDNAILWTRFFKTYFEHPAFGKFPLAFGMGPALREMQPGIMQWYFEHASPTTEFIADVSGAGYVKPESFGLDRPEPVWADFLGWTASLMKSNGMKSLRTVRGSDANLARYSSALPFCHSLFADMGRYSGRSGIANLTYSLADGMPVFRSVTSWRNGKEGFLREVREQVGKQRPAFVNGFLHCWTFTMEDIVRIHAERDADMVFVTPAQLAALYRQALK